MKYSEIRDTLQSGDILAWTHRFKWTWYDFKCYMVRLFTVSEYSHVGVCIVQDGRVWVLEAVTPTVRLVPLSDEVPCFVLKGKGLTEEQKLRGMALVGKAKYSQWEAILAYFGKNDLNNDRWECAELVDYVLDLNLEATPASLVDELLQQGYPMYTITKD
jgi:hypothetical protein